MEQVGKAVGVPRRNRSGVVCHATIPLSEYVWQWVDGISVFCVTTGQIWDASWWKRDDWEAFCRPDFDKLSVLETMTEYARWEDLYAAYWRNGQRDAVHLCPFCGSDDISGDSWEQDGPTVSQVVDCLDCGETWVDSYGFVGFERVEQLEGAE